MHSLTDKETKTQDSPPLKTSDMAGHGCMVSWCFNLCNSIERVFKPGHFHFQSKTAPEKSLQYQHFLARAVGVQPSEASNEESGGNGEKSPRPSLHTDSQNGSGAFSLP